MLTLNESLKSRLPERFTLCYRYRVIAFGSLI